MTSSETTQPQQGRGRHGRGPGDAGTGESEQHAKVPTKSVWREYAEALLMAAVLALLIRTFGFQAFRIPTGSMEDTLLF